MIEKGDGIMLKKIGYYIILFSAFNQASIGLFSFDILKYIFKTNIVFIEIIQIMIGFGGILSLLPKKN